MNYGFCTDIPEEDSNNQKIRLFPDDYNFPFTLSLSCVEDADVSVLLAKLQQLKSEEGNDWTNEDIPNSMKKKFTFNFLQ